MGEMENKQVLDEMEDSIRTVGVLTSGGDAPGMNAAIRAVVRTALSHGLKVRGIRKGYHGLLKEEIIDLSARDVSDTIQRGGTLLQTARCKSMRTTEGQQKAAAICKKYGIVFRIARSCYSIILYIVVNGFIHFMMLCCCIKTFSRA